MDRYAKVIPGEVPDQGGKIILPRRDHECWLPNHIQRDIGGLVRPGNKTLYQCNCGQYWVFASDGNDGRWYRLSNWRAKRMIRKANKK